MSRLADKYELGGSSKDKLGAGSYGIVIKGRRLADNKPVAIKQCSYCPIDGCPQSFLRECSTLRTLRGNANIVPLLDVFFEESALMLVMPLYSCDLFAVIKNNPTGIPGSLTRHLAAQILQGLASCHENGIIHRDLKPGNILVHFPECSLVLADFGLARFAFVSDDTLLTSEVVTLNYRPPELFFDDNRQKESYGCAVDIWAFGCILFEMKMGRLLFSHTDITDEIRHVHDEDGPLTNLWPWRNLFNVVSQMLAIDPKQRPSTFHLISEPYFLPE